MNINPTEKIEDERVRSARMAEERARRKSICCFFGWNSAASKSDWLQDGKSETVSFPSRAHPPSDWISSSPAPNAVNNQVKQAMESTLLFPLRLTKHVTVSWLFTFYTSEQHIKKYSAFARLSNAASASIYFQRSAFASWSHYGELICCSLSRCVPRARPSTDCVREKGWSEKPLCQNGSLAAHIKVNGRG